MHSKLNRVLAILTVLIMITGIASPVMSYAAQEIMESQGDATNNKNIKFDVFFEDGKHESYSDNLEESQINIRLKVENSGYLEDINVDFSSCNFDVVEDKYNGITSVDDNKVTLNKINANEERVIAIKVKPIVKDNVSLDSFSKESEVKLSAKYINELGEEKQIEGLRKVAKSWSANVTSTLEQEISKYLPVVVENNKVLMVEQTIKSGIENNTLPVKQNILKVQVPEIEGILPEEITVTAVSEMTNGDSEGIKFSKNNYIYNREEKTLNIFVVNTGDSISWKKNSIDEFKITYIYEGNVLELIDNKAENIEISVKNEITTYDSQNQVIEKEIRDNFTQSEKLGDIVSLEVNIPEKISKGYMISNLKAEEKERKATEYQNTYVANIGYNKLVDGLEFNLYSEADQIKINSIEISKNIFMNILGADGEIEITSKGTPIAKITSNSEAENNIYKVDVRNYYINDLEIKTSNVINEGKFEFKVNKEFSKDISFTRNEIESLQGFTTDTTLKAYYENLIINEENIENFTAFENTDSHTSVELNNSTLSTMVKNENVIFKVLLEADSIDDTLYKNPKVRIVLPKSLQNISNLKAEMVFDDELKFTNVNIEEQYDGSKVLEFDIEGEVTKYNLSSRGAVVLISTDIELDKLEVSKEEKVYVVVNNEEDNSEKIMETTFNIVAPEGLITRSSIVEEDREIVSSINNSELATIDLGEGSKDLEFNKLLVNNYDETLSNISILARTPYEGNKEIGSEKDLGTTMNLTNGDIEIEGISDEYVNIYYSNVADADKNLSDAANGWTTNKNEVDEIKSYLVVLNGYEMNKGDNLKVSYQTSVDNLEHNNKAFDSYAVYFNNEAGEDLLYAPSVGISTGSGPVLNASLSTQGNTGNVVKYKLNVKNTGTKNATNAKVVFEVPSELMYVEPADNQVGYRYGEYTSRVIEERDESGALIGVHSEITIDIDDIGINQTLEKDIWFVVSNNSKELNYSIKGKVVSGDIVVYTNELNSRIGKASFNVVTAKQELSSSGLKEGDKVKYAFIVKSTSDVRNNTKLRITLPEELSYDSYKVEQSNRNVSSDNLIEVNNKTLTVSLGSVDGTSSKQVTITLNVGKFNDDVVSKDVEVKAQISADNCDTQTISLDRLTLNKAGLKVIQETNIPEGSTIAPGEDFAYIFTLTNLSNIALDNITFVDVLPDGVSFNDIEINYDKGSRYVSTEKDQTGNPRARINLGAGKVATVKVNVLAGFVNEDLTIKNTARISHDLLGTIETTAITHIIQKYVSPTGGEEEPSSPVVIPDDPSTPGDVTNSRRITGTIWKDENRNGIREDNEGRLSNVRVLLLDNRTGNIATSNRGVAQDTTTDGNGSYMFTDVRAGRYSVVYVYDSGRYSATIYNAEGAGEAFNSDAVDVNVTLDGKTRIAAVSNEIVITSENKYNVDLGLVEDAKFDLSLNTVVETIALTTNGNTNTYSYGTNFAKADVKNDQADDTTIVATYKIRVTNEGGVAGYAKKISNKIPDDFKFNSELNNNWYEGNDGLIYSNALANTIIKPGETKELTLVLTKRMSYNSFGLSNNTTEIAEATNDYGLEDIDSIPGNRATGEDDIANADILISVRTGDVYIYLGIIFAVIAITGMGIAIINKKVLGKRVIG